MLNIAAFTFKFDQLEDRVLLVGNYNNKQPRIDFWLTRKLVMRLLAKAQELIEKTSGSIATAPAEHKSQLAQFDHDQAWRSSSVEHENQTINAINAELLTRVDFAFKNGNYQLLFYALGDEALATSILNYEELHQVLHLIHKGALSLDWGVMPSLFEVQSSPTILQ
ncbi:MAG: hypothetical protein ACRBB6_12105 [Neptuniibacter sp.]